MKNGRTFAADILDDHVALTGRRATCKVQPRIVAIFLGLIVLAFSTGCESSKEKPKPLGSPKELSISTYSGDQSALIWIAKDRGYFSKQGVNVRLETRNSGVASFRDLLEGKIDLATVAEYVFVSDIVERPDLCILAVIAQVDNIELVGRRDRGITQISDIRNKRIGIVRNSAADYFFHILLMFQQIEEKDVRIVDLDPAQQVEQITRGDIDAAVVWSPFPGQIKAALGNKAVSWSVQNGQDFYWLLVCTRDTLRKKPSAIRSTLAALAMADNLIKSDRHAAKAIVASQIGVRHFPESWEADEFKLVLKRPLILAMEAEFTWMNDQLGNRGVKMPNMLDFIHFDALHAVNPERVRMPR